MDTRLRFTVSSMKLFVRFDSAAVSVLFMFILDTSIDCVDLGVVCDSAVALAL